jgi:methylated-DNA-[protein]-cysteine S-methyltransferase
MPTTALTPFRQAVIDEMLQIPYGSTVSYGDMAKAIAKKRGGRVSAQAVGGAVGWNPICIIIPCHRVIGADGSLTGYGGGLENKVSLLAHEKFLKELYLKVLLRKKVGSS